MIQGRHQKLENTLSGPKPDAATKHYESSSVSSSEMASSSGGEVPAESSSASNGSRLIEASKSLIIPPEGKVMKADEVSADIASDGDEVGIE